MISSYLYPPPLSSKGLLPSILLRGKQFFYLGDTKMRLRWREEPVQVKGKGVEFLISAVSFKRSELDPPRHSPVSGTVLVVKSIVEEYSNNQCHCW